MVIQLRACRCSDQHHPGEPSDGHLTGANLTKAAEALVTGTKFGTCRMA
jgi:hypothetical protein